MRRIHKIWIAAIACLLFASVEVVLATNNSREQFEQLLQNVEHQKHKQVKQLLGRLNGIYDRYFIKEGNREAQEEYNPEHLLQVFVSSSMGKEALIHYGIEAKKYGASLVLRGLPGGSFRELSEFVHEISKQALDINLQIDDLSFSKFGISKVPSIVLSREADCFMRENCLPSFDKVNGAISIRGALKLISEKGDIADIAKAVLRNGQKQQVGRK